MQEARHSCSQITLRANHLHAKTSAKTPGSCSLGSWPPRPLAGAPPPPGQLVSREGVRDCQVDNTAIYYAASDGVFRAPLSGGAGVEIADVVGDVFLGQDATSLYLRRSNSSGTTIYRILK